MNKEKKNEKSEEHLRDIWDNIKHINNRIMLVPEGERQKGSEKIFEEIITENFPSMGKETLTQVEGAQRFPYKITHRRNAARHILIKLTKIKFKEKILRTTREKQQVTHKGIPIRITADLSVETLQARGSGNIFFRFMKRKNLEPRILYPAKFSFRFDGEIKSFADKENLRKFSTSKPVLHQLLKELL
uniref:L1 transposable element RRM domain-containing protein n=1 Tax=Sus scrofa TaxID=9823 RepID=A0A8D1F356_PIG